MAVGAEHERRPLAAAGLDGLVAEGEDPKEASAKTNKATKAKVADRAAVLVDQGFTAVDGGIFYPEEGAQPASAAAVGRLAAMATTSRSASRASDSGASERSRASSAASSLDGAGTSAAADSTSARASRVSESSAASSV